MWKKYRLSEQDISIGFFEKKYIVLFSAKGPRVLIVRGADGLTADIHRAWKWLTAFLCRFLHEGPISKWLKFLKLKNWDEGHSIHHGINVVDYRHPLKMFPFSLSISNWSELLACGVRCANKIHYKLVFLTCL